MENGGTSGGRQKRGTVNNYLIVWRHIQGGLEKEHPKQTVSRSKVEATKHYYYLHKHVVWRYA